MKHLKKSFTVLVFLTIIIGSRTSAQDPFSSLTLLHQIKNLDRAKEVMQDNEYTSTGHEQGHFYTNPLMLNGKPLDYTVFSLGSKGELTVMKGAAVTGQGTKVPFYVYLRSSENKVIIGGKERSDPKQIKIDIEKILRYAKPGDQLVIEPVRKEDGPVKRILKLLKSGC